MVIEMVATSFPVLCARFEENGVVEAVVMGHQQNWHEKEGMHSAPIVHRIVPTASVVDGAAATVTTVTTATTTATPATATSTTTTATAVATTTTGPRLLQPGPRLPQPRPPRP
jgi:hypothetical protein